MGAFPKSPIFSAETSVFIETGTASGRSSRIAFEIGFSQVHSCDIRSISSIDDLLRVSGFHYEKRKSTDFLTDVLASLEERATFWLDAHPPDFSPGAWSLWDELDLILAHRVKDHVIVVDDWDIIRRQFPERLEQRILAANPLYSFAAITFNRIPDILIAETCLGISSSIINP